MTDKLKTIQQIFNTTAWEKGSFRNYYFISTYNNRQLNGCFECEFNELDSYGLEHLKQIYASLPDLDQRAHELIQTKFPEDDAKELDLNDLILLPNGAFKLGYYTGRTPMGETYIYVSFDPNLIVQDEINVEGY